MLILSRKVGEALVLTCPGGERIEVLVTDIRRVGTGRPYCKIGIEAPNAVHVRRDELPELAVYTEGKTDVADGDQAQ